MNELKSKHIALSVLATGWIVGCSDVEKRERAKDVTANEALSGAAETSEVPAAPAAAKAASTPDSSLPPAADAIVNSGALMALTAETADASRIGAIDLTIDFTDDGSIARVSVLRHAGRVLPEKPCESGVTVLDLVAKDLANQELEDLTTDPGAPFSYVACIYDAKGQLTSTASVLNVLSRSSPSHVIFVSSKTFRGDQLPGQTADQHCQEMAELANLEGSFKALLGRMHFGFSGGAPTLTYYQNGKDNVPLETPILNVKGDLVATADKFWTRIHKNPVLFDEYGTPKPEATVWTGFDADGVTPIPANYIEAGYFRQSDYTCSTFARTTGYTLRDENYVQGLIVQTYGLYGIAGAKDSNWSRADNWSPEPYSCSYSRSIYCISEVAPIYPDLTGTWDDNRGYVAVVEAGDGDNLIMSMAGSRVVGTRFGSREIRAWGTTAVVSNNNNTITWANGAIWTRSN